MKILSHASAKKKTKMLKKFQISQFFYWPFSRDIMAVKGLMLPTTDFPISAVPFHFFPLTASKSVKIATDPLNTNKFQSPATTAI